jgi:ABC-type Fe3+-hydroxamate transport system substrate-binding protein
VKRRTVLTGLVLLPAVAACGRAPDPVAPRPSPTPTLGTRKPPQEGITRADMAGREVTIPADPTRFVALSPSAVHFLLALGIEPVGRPSDVTLPEVASVPEVGSTLSPNFPAIDALDPDVVIADAAFHGARRRDFDQFPHAVYVIHANSYDTVIATFTALGQVTGRPDSAAAAVTAVEERLAAITARIAGAPAPSVLIVTGAGRDLYAGSDATYLGSLMAKLNATNVLATAPEGAPIPGFGLIELGQAATLGPDVVLVITSGEGGLAETIRTSPFWASSKAVRAGRVHELDNALFLRSPGPSITTALDQLAALLYPGR